jgi:hypothetical protein
VPSLPLEGAVSAVIAALPPLRLRLPGRRPPISAHPPTHQHARIHPPAPPPPSFLPFLLIQPFLPRRPPPPGPPPPPPQSLRGKTVEEAERALMDRLVKYIA